MNVGNNIILHGKFPCRILSINKNKTKVTGLHIFTQEKYVQTFVPNKEYHLQSFDIKEKQFRVISSSPDYSRIYIKTPNKEIRCLDKYLDPHRRFHNRLVEAYKMTEENKKWTLHLNVTCALKQEQITSFIIKFKK